MVPFPLQTIIAADVDDVVVVVIVIFVAVGFPNNLKKLKDGAVLWVWIRMDPH